MNTRQAIRAGIAAALLVARVSLAMAAGATITGTVTLGDGTPTAGAFIIARIADEQTRTVEADDNGEYVLENVTAGKTWELIASLKGYATARESNVPVKQDGETVEVNFTLYNTGTITGHVLRETDGTPIAGAIIEYLGGTLPRVLVDHDTVTDEQGRFTFGGLDMGHYVFRAWARGFVEANTYGGPGVSGNADLTPEKPHADVVLCMIPGGIGSGRVVNEDGQPVVGARTLFIEGRGDDLKRRVNITRRLLRAMDFPRDLTNKRGEFTVSSARAGILYNAVAVHPDYLISASDKEFRLAEGQHLADIQIVMKRGATLTGRVADPDGRPVAGAKVTVRSSTRPRSFRERYYSDKFGVTNEAGEFEVGVLEPGWKTVRVDAAGLAPAAVPVRVDPGGSEITISSPGRADLVLDGVVVPEGQTIDGIEAVLGAAVPQR